MLLSCLLLFLTDCSHFKTEEKSDYYYKKLEDQYYKAGIATRKSAKALGETLKDLWKTKEWQTVQKAQEADLKSFLIWFKAKYKYDLVTGKIKQ